MVTRKILIRKRDILPYIYEKGLSAREVGKIFKLSTQTIKAYLMELREAGYDAPKRKAGRRHIRL